MKATELFPMMTVNPSEKRLVEVLAVEIHPSSCLQAAFTREKLGGFFVLGLHDDDALNKCGCGSMPYLRTLAVSVREPQQSCIYKPCF